MDNKILSPEEFTRLATNFYVNKGLDNQLNRIPLDAEMMNYVLGNVDKLQKKFKIAFCCVCLNPNYWQFIKPLVEGAKNYFLPGHQTDFFIWSDIVKPDSPSFETLEQKLFDIHLSSFGSVQGEQLLRIQQYAEESFEKAKEASVYAQNLTIFPMESEVWPMPTLMRYHLMLQQEEKLKEYDYVFYCDVDMLFVNIVGDEILGEGLTMVQQPMYAVRKEFWPPYEPNPDSASYIKRPGRLINDQGKPRFMPLYFAGGFQGGKTEIWLEAMKEMKKLVDKDFTKNYIPVWNDETVFNKYMFDNLSDKDIVLSPSYTYPDTLQREYFIPMWGREYEPKLVTLTKKFSLSTEGAEHVQKMIQQTQQLK